jgi:cytoskeleton protein RodZ
MTSQDQSRRLRLRRKQAAPAPLRPEGVQPPVSERLRAARQARGLDFFRIERDTKIRIRFLEAIEDGRFDDLPGEIYARGFIRNYASYLGLDPESIESQWRVQTGQPAPEPLTPRIKPRPRNVIPQPMPEPPKPAPNPATPAQPMPEPPKPAPKPARADSVPAAAVVEEAESEAQRPAIRLPSLPRPKRPSVTLPALRMPALSLPKLGRSGAVDTAEPTAAEAAEAAAAAVASAAASGVAAKKRKPRKPAEAVAGPEPVPTAGPRLLFQPVHLVLLAMAAVVLLIAGYFGLQVTRIMDYPSVEVTSPDRAVMTLAPGTIKYVLRGTATPGTTIMISWDEREPNTVIANSDGRWSFETPLHSGLNQFTVFSRNERTNHNSSEVTVILDVPVPTASPTPLLVVVDSPVDGETVKPGDVTVKGTTVGIVSVTVTPTYLGPPQAPSPTPRPSPTPGAPTEVPTLMPLPTATPTPAEGETPTPRPTPSPTPNPNATPGPEAVNVIPTVDGKFTATLKLTPGTWKLTVVGSDSDGNTAPPVELTVIVPAPTLTVTIEVKGGSAWLKIWKDGIVLPGYSKDFPAGTVITIVANESVWIRTGSAVKTYVTINGVSYGPLGGARSGSWRITGAGPPVASQDV